MAATRPQQNLAQDCITAAHAAAGLASVQRNMRADPAPVRAFSRMLSAASSNWPGRLTVADRRILWALPQAAPEAVSTEREVAQLALVWSQRIDSGSKAELPANELNASKMFCLRMSDALGHKSKALSF